jgi:hypothetical protein
LAQLKHQLILYILQGGGRTPAKMSASEKEVNSRAFKFVYTFRIKKLFKTKNGFIYENLATGTGMVSSMDLQYQQ